MRPNADETTAEYLMSCLPSAPLPDVATKDFAAAELSKFATKDELAQLEAKIDAGFEHAAKECAAGFAAAEETWVSGFTAAEEKRAAGRTAADKHYRQLRAVGILIAVEIPAFEAGWLDWFKDIAASPF